MNIMKNSVENINSRLEQAEEIIWELEGRPFETIEAGGKKMKEWKIAYINYKKSLKTIFALWEPKKEKKRRERDRKLI